MKREREMGVGRKEESRHKVREEKEEEGGGDLNLV